MSDVVTEVTSEKPDGLVIDRNRITHRESMDQTFMGAKIERMNADLASGKNVDFDEMRRLMDAVDLVTSKTITGLPEGWLPVGVTLATEGWIHQLGQEHYETVAKLARPRPAGEKKA